MLCHFWWTLTLKRESGQSSLCRFFLLQHSRFIIKPRLSLDSVTPPLGKFRVVFWSLPWKVLWSYSLSDHPHWVLSPPTTTQSFSRDWFNLSELPDGVFIFSASTSPLKFFCLLFYHSSSKTQAELALIALSLHLYTPISNGSYGWNTSRKGHAPTYQQFSFCLQVQGSVIMQEFPCIICISRGSALARSFFCFILPLSIIFLARFTPGAMCSPAVTQSQGASFIQHPFTGCSTGVRGASF